MQERPNLNTLSKQIAEANKLKGFHDKEHSNEHYLCLVISELMEAVEADRKGKEADLNRLESWLKEDKKFFTEPFVWFIKDTVADELADAIIRLLDLAGLRGWDIDWDTKVYHEYFKTISFTESVFSATRLLLDDEIFTNSKPKIAIAYIEGLAYSLNIDIWRHVELKLKYNARRPKLHGKRY